MDSIMGQKEQQAALREIKAACKEMESTNKFLTCSNKEGKYTISYIADDGSRCSATADAASKDEIDRFILRHKQLITNNVVELADKNRIMLDPEEKELFGLELTAEEREELDARLLAKLEAEEQSSAAAEDADNFDESENGENESPYGSL